MVLALLIPFALLAIAISATPRRIGDGLLDGLGDGLLALDEETRLAVFLTFAAAVALAALTLT